jgi:magnesium chelatase subunit D
MRAHASSAPWPNSSAPRPDVSDVVARDRAALADALDGPSPASSAQHEPDRGDALLAAGLLWVDPHGLGGLRLRAGAGAARDSWLRVFESLRPAGPPLVRMPAHIGDERLLGGLDLTATLARGKPVAQRGLLAQADGGIVAVAMAERVEAGAASRLAAALDRGVVEIAREGIESVSPARIGVLLLDEGEGDDEAPPVALVDRCALAVDLRSTGWREAPRRAPFNAHDVERARAVLGSVVVPAELLEAIVAAAGALGVDAVRPALLALRACRAHAALYGRATVEADDAAAAVRLVLLPRATRLPQAAQPEEEDAPADEPPPEEPPAEEPPDDDASREAASPPATPDAPLEDRLVEAALASLPADLLLQLQAGTARRARSAGRSGAAARSGLRGRPIGARRALPRGGQRLALIDTLRAAAPWQKLRGAAGTGRIAVRPDDFHVKRHRQRQATTTIFAIDASGSAALARLAEAKGAVETLLAECYVRRDEVAVLAFRGQRAELLLPPTRSLVRAKRSLAGLPGGGGTPLASGLEAAAALAERIARDGATPVLVLLTDGRANIARDGTPGRERAGADALAAARALRLLGILALVVDTSARPDPAARAIAEAIGATYLPLPPARPDRVARAAQALVPGRA